MFTDILNLITDTRYLAANGKYDNLLKEIESDVSGRYDNLKKRIDEHMESINLMKERVSLCNDALQLTNETISDSWIYGVSLFGVTTHYQLCEDGSLLLRLEGSRNDLPLFEQLAVIHEIELFPTWLPMCQQANLITKITHADLIAHVKLQFPFLSREFALRCFGADCLYENGNILLLGSAIEDWENPPIPWEPKGWFHDRMVMRHFKAAVKVSGPTSAKVRKKM